MLVKRDNMEGLAGGDGHDEDAGAMGRAAGQDGSSATMEAHP